MKMCKARKLVLPLALICLLILAVLSPKPVLQASSHHAAIDVPFFSQTAVRDRRISAGQPLYLGNDPAVPLWEYGCGVASLAMVYSHYGVDTDVIRLNETLRQTDPSGFAGALLAWDRPKAFRQAGRPWIEGIERVDTAQPRDHQKRVDAELANGHPVIAYLSNQHYVVLVGKDAKGNYLINDPWKLTADDGRGIAIEQNDLKLKFDDIRQFVFVYPERNAPTNGVPVSGVIADKYFAWGGARGSLGNPKGPAGATSDGGQYQIFERGAILAVEGGVYALQGPVWEKYLAEGLSRQTTTTADTERPQLAPGGRVALGWPRSDSYSYFVGRTVQWRADFANGSIVWTEGSRPRDARVLTAENAVRAEYFANPNLSGKPAYVRFEEDLLFDWREGRSGPWAEVDGFSARYTSAIWVGFPLGWWYNFVVEADEGVRVKVDGETVLDAWTGGAGVHKFTRRLGRGAHTLVVEYREVSGQARLRAAWSAAPASPTFAAEGTAGPFDLLPASAAASVRELATSIAQATMTSAPTSVPERAEAMPTVTALQATVQALKTQVAVLSTALAEAKAQPKTTPTPSASGRLVGKWELLGDDGDCLSGADVLEFFPDGKYVAAQGFWDDSSQFGGNYSILDGNRIRLELPFTGLAVCQFMVKENTLSLTGTGGKTGQYVRYQEFPSAAYPLAIVGRWRFEGGSKNVCFKPFEDTPKELTLAPGGEFLALGFPNWYGQYEVSGAQLGMRRPVKLMSTPTPRRTTETGMDAVMDLFSIILGGASTKPLQRFEGVATCRIERVTGAYLVLGDGEGNQTGYRRIMSKEQLILEAEATATAIALLPPTSTPTPTATPTPTPPMLSIIPFDYQVKDIGDGWKKGTVRLAFENLSDRPVPPQCLIFQEQKESSKGWLESPCEQAFQIVITNVYIETQEGKTYQATPSSSEIRLGAVGDDARFTIPPGFPFQNVYSGWGISFDTISFRFAQAAHPTQLVLQREEGDFVLDLMSVPQTIPTPNLDQYAVKPITELGKRPIIDLPGKVRFAFDGQCYHQKIPGFYQKGILLPWTLVNYNQFDTEWVNPDFLYAVYYPGGLLEYDKVFTFDSKWSVGPGQTERYYEMILDEDLGDGDVAAAYMIVFEPAGGLTVYELNCEER